MSIAQVVPPAARARVPVVEALPVGPAGVVEVHVGVHRARHDQVAAGVDLAAAAGEPGTHLGHDPVHHGDVPGVAAHHEVVDHGAASRRSRMIAAISSTAVARSASASFSSRRS